MERKPVQGSIKEKWKKAFANLKGHKYRESTDSNSSSGGGSQQNLGTVSISCLCLKSELCQLHKCFHDVYIQQTHTHWCLSEGSLTVRAKSHVLCDVLSKFAYGHFQFRQKSFHIVIRTFRLAFTWMHFRISHYLSREFWCRNGI